MVRTSIVAPTWKHGKHVAKCVGSLLVKQTMRDFELIMVLDGMECQDPETLQFIEKHRDNPQLRVLKLEKNCGQATAINHGMNAAVGTDFLTWVHIDNEFQPKWLEKMVRFLDEHDDVDFVWSWLERQCGDHFKDKWVAFLREVLREQSQSFLFRRSLLERVGQQRGDYAHDTDWFLRAQESGVFGELREVLMIRRSHPGCVSRTQRHRDESSLWIEEAKERRGGKL